jgi:hypothetical protein
MDKIAITIEINPHDLRSYTDTHLATLWHVAQANPAAFDDRAAGELAEHIGREVIRRWLTTRQPELWTHQGEHYYWNTLRRLGKWVDGEFVPDANPAENEATAPG